MILCLIISFKQTTLKYFKKCITYLKYFLVSKWLSDIFLVGSCEQLINFDLISYQQNSVACCKVLIYSFELKDVLKISIKT